MLKKEIFKSKVLALGVISAFLLLVSPVESFTQAPAESGLLTGFIYNEDLETPLKNAVVKIRNVENGREFQSDPTNEDGMYEIKNIEEGRYVIGVATDQGNFNFDYTVFVKSKETAKLTLALKPGANSLLEGESLVGKIESYDPNTGMARIIITKGSLGIDDRIHIKGKITDFKQDVLRLLNLDGSSIKEALEGETTLLEVASKVEAGDLVYKIEKKKGIWAFFTSTAGMLVLIAVGTALTVGIVTLGGPAPPASPAKKKRI